MNGDQLLHTISVSRTPLLTETEDVSEAPEYNARIQHYRILSRDHLRSIKQRRSESSFGKRFLCLFVYRLSTDRVK
jgi:hypothetical protein